MKRPNAISATATIVLWPGGRIPLMREFSISSTAALSVVVPDEMGDSAQTGILQDTQNSQNTQDTQNSQDAQGPQNTSGTGTVQNPDFMTGPGAQG